MQQRRLRNSANRRRKIALLSTVARCSRCSTPARQPYLDCHRCESPAPHKIATRNRSVREAVTNHMQHYVIIHNYIPLCPNFLPTFTRPFLPHGKGLGTRLINIMNFITLINHCIYIVARAFSHRHRYCRAGETPIIQHTLRCIQCNLYLKRASDAGEYIPLVCGYRTSVNSNPVSIRDLASVNELLLGTPGFYTDNSWPCRCCYVGNHATIG